MIVRKPLDPSKMYVAQLAGYTMVLYPDPQPWCLMTTGAVCQWAKEEAQRAIANPQEIIDYLNKGEVDYETNIRYCLGTK